MIRDINKPLSYKLPAISPPLSCHRLGKTCEPPAPVRKRKARTPPPQQQPPVGPNSRLEEKLDDLVSLLRSQAGEKQPQPPPQLVSTDLNTPSTTPGTICTNSQSLPATPSTSANLQPQVTVDTDTSVIHVLRPAPDYPMSLSPILEDVSAHHFPALAADAQLDLFRRVFLPTFPFVHLPSSMTAADLRHQKPFLWLVVMCYTTKNAARQFAIEETVWQIVSRRVVAQHMADLDLLLGVVCFASWSHYFKKDKPFMVMLAQMALAMAVDLGIDRDAPPANTTRHTRSGRVLTQQAPPKPQTARTMEERRAILAVHHLVSAMWSAYRKIQPLRWTAYMDVCLGMAGEGRETALDIVLATQIKCQLITNHLTVSEEGDEGAAKTPVSAVLVAALLSQSNAVRQSVPAHMQSHKIIQLYLFNTDITIQERYIRNSTTAKAARGSSSGAAAGGGDHSGMAQLRRVQELDATLTSIERWLAAFSGLSMEEWLGVTVDVFAQMMHTVVVLFKLTTLADDGDGDGEGDDNTDSLAASGWDGDAVRRRADMHEILDTWLRRVERIPAALGLVDADGPRRGLFFKTPFLLRAVKALFVAETGPPRRAAPANSHVQQQQAVDINPGPGPDNNSAAAAGASTSPNFLTSEGSGLGADGGGYYNVNAPSMAEFGEDFLMIPDDFLLNLTNEPYLSDIVMGATWDTNGINMQQQQQQQQQQGDYQYYQNP
ncbi:hypothetical protein B0T24DRAFT_144101 [Lasiosphaeria ovina]|uniref:Transcription factor domain-containing protein n=1 Tax=Lasiosphaeria ovina TaxID=92902 RepID=A0AAE0ND41_9PEZI|nr:hypothetical protein B0T24DRAFT_144101 [Lasiosphaeria ovina]